MGAHFFHFFWIFEQGLNGLCGGFGVFYGDEQAVAGVGAGFAAARVCGGDDGAASGAGFKEHFWDAFAVIRRVANEGGAGVEGGHVGDFAEPFNGGVFDHGVHIVFGDGARVVVGYAAGDLEAGGRAFFGEDFGGLDEDGDAFVMDEACWHEDDGGGVIRQGCGGKLSEVNAGAADECALRGVYEAAFDHELLVVGVLEDDGGAGVFEGAFQQRADEQA